MPDNDDVENVVNLDDVKEALGKKFSGGGASSQAGGATPFQDKDLFGGTSKTSTDDDEKAKKAKSDNFERILDQYFAHLNLILSCGSYSDFMDPDEIIKMAEIKHCTITSSHPRVSALSSLFDKVVTFVRNTWNPVEAEKWLQAINDAVADLRYKNNMSALTCPTDKLTHPLIQAGPKVCVKTLF